MTAIHLTCYWRDVSLMFNLDSVAAHEIYSALSTKSLQFHVISVGDRQNYAPSLKSSQTHKVQCTILRARETVNRIQSASAQSLDQTIHVLASLFVMFVGFSAVALTMSILSMTLQHHPLSCELCE